MGEEQGRGGGGVARTYCLVMKKLFVTLFQEVNFLVSDVWVQVYVRLAINATEIAKPMVMRTTDRSGKEKKHPLGPLFFENSQWKMNTVS